MDRAEHLVTYSAKPVFKLVGQRYGSRTQASRRRDPQPDERADLHPDRVRGSPQAAHEGETLTIGEDEVEVQRTATGELTAKAEAGYVVALDPAVTPELRLEGLARELVNRVQNLRKESGLKVEDRIRLGIFGDGEILDVARAWGEFVAGETLAEELETGSVTDFEGYASTREVDLDGVTGTIALARRVPRDSEN
jgi:isoleucyl-tRNA synthetase